MSEETLSSQGLKLYSETDTEGTFEEITGVTDLSPFDGSRSEQDATTLGDTDRVAEPGLNDFGNVSFTMFYKPGSTVHQRIEADKADGVKRKYAIVYPDKDETTKTFMAWPSGVSPSASVDSRLAADVTLRVYTKDMRPKTETGGVTTAAGA